MRLSGFLWCLIVLGLASVGRMCCAAPRFESGNPEVDRLFAEAVRAVDESLVGGMIPIPDDPADRVAEVYLPIWLSLSLTHPEASKKTLASLLEEEHIIDLEGYPERLDPLFWILAAESPDEEFCDRYMPAMARLCRLVWQERGDPKTGLLRGGLGWIAGREAFGHTRKPEDVFSLAGNAVAEAALTLIKQNARGAQGSLLDPAWFSERQKSIGSGIETHLREPDDHYYRRARDAPEWCGLGSGIAVFAGSIDPYLAATSFERIPWTPRGIPERFPSDRSMPEWRPNHSVLWETQAVWARSANRCRRAEILQRILSCVTVRPDLLETEGIDQRTGECVSTSNPIIPASSFLGVVYRGVLGLGLVGGRLAVRPLIPSEFAESLSLSGFQFGESVIDLNVTGHGVWVKHLSLDGEPQDDLVLPILGSGRHRVDVEMASLPNITGLQTFAVAGEELTFRVEHEPGSSEPLVKARTRMDDTSREIDAVSRSPTERAYRITMDDESPYAWVLLWPGEDAPLSRKGDAMVRAVHRAETLVCSVQPASGAFPATPAAALGSPFRVEMINRSGVDTASGIVRPEVPPGWTVAPAEREFGVAPGEHITQTFDVRLTGIHGAWTDILTFRVHTKGEERVVSVPLWRCDGIDLTGEWRFRVGDDPAWADPAVSDATWDTIRVPGWWEDQGHSDEGWAWYRKTFVIPEDWEGAWSIITAGAIDDEETLFVNGNEIGSDKGWDQPRRYVVPPHVIRPGDTNLIAFRVKDYYGGGGICKGPVRWIAGPTIESLSGHW